MRVYLDLDVVNKMACSPDYKVRFASEYLLLKNRYDKLVAMCDKYECGLKCGDVTKFLGFVPDCPLELLREQQKAMGMYLGALDKRCLFEKIDVWEIFDDCMPVTTCNAEDVDDDWDMK